MDKLHFDELQKHAQLPLPQGYPLDIDITDDLQNLQTDDQQTLQTINDPNVKPDNGTDIPHISSDNQLALHKSPKVENSMSFKTNEPDPHKPINNNKPVKIATHNHGYKTRQNKMKPPDTDSSDDEDHPQIKQVTFA